MELHCCTGVTQQQRPLRAIVREYRPGKLLVLTAQSTESAVCEYRRTPLSTSEEQGAAAQTRLIQQHACNAECRIHSTKQLRVLISKRSGDLSRRFEAQEDKVSLEVGSYC
jgi:hypothetical protein